MDLENDCLDVFVTLENDVCYLIEVITPKFFCTLLYHIRANLNIEDINEILDRKEKEDMELEAEIDVEIEAESN